MDMFGKPNGRFKTPWNQSQSVTRALPGGENSDHLGPSAVVFLEMQAKEAEATPASPAPEPDPFPNFPPTCAGKLWSRPDGELPRVSQGSELLVP